MLVGGGGVTELHLMEERVICRQSRYFMEEGGGLSGWLPVCMCTLLY